MYFEFPENIKIKERFCFQCGKQITFGEYTHRNYDDLNELRLVELWENEYIELFCCLCYESLLKENTFFNAIESLSSESQEALSLIERKYKLELPFVRAINFNTTGFTIKDGQIEGLGLFRQNLNLFPEEILFLPELKKLNLAWNNLISIPKSIQSLEKLQILDLSGNKLEKLPLSIGNLRFLRELDVSFNQLQKLPFTIGALTSLKVLKLIKNKLVEIPHIFQFLEKSGLKVFL